MNYYKPLPGNFRESGRLVALRDRLTALIYGRRGGMVERLIKGVRDQIRYERLSAARAIATHTDEQWAAILNEFDNRCVCCGAKYVGGRPAKDHIVPLYLGGSDGADNLQPLCRECNTRKGPDTFDWAAYRRDHGFEVTEAA